MIVVVITVVVVVGGVAVVVENLFVGRGCVWKDDWMNCCYWNYGLEVWEKWWSREHAEESARVCCMEIIGVGIIVAGIVIRSVV